MKPFISGALIALATTTALAQKAPELKLTPGISVIKFVAPIYPPPARAARMQGDVRLLVHIARRVSMSLRHLDQ
jgi:hypothetical protein